LSLEKEEKMTTIFITSPSFAKDNPDVFELFRKAHIDVSVSDLNRAHSSREILQRIGDSEGLLVFNTFDEVNNMVILKSPSLKVISRHGVGMENIDVKTAEKEGIVVKNTANAHEEESVSDFTVGLLISCARNIPGFNEETKHGKWNRRVTRDVSGGVIGIIGLGKVGRCVAHKARAFNMKIIAYEIYPDREFCSQNHIELVDLPRLMKDADFVSLHVPLTEETHQMIGAPELKLMKSSAFFINTARAQVVDLDALYHALVNHQMAGAAIDVFQSEPPTGNPLLGLDNVIATPHIAALTQQVVRNMDIEAAINAITALNPAFQKDLDAPLR
jgi:D-3-phosphoglycerate dehydrogenase